MIPFDLLEPASLMDAIAAIDPDDPTVRPIAGGTALMLMMKAGVFQPRRLVSLRRINGGMRGISAGPDGALTIGALTPLSAVEHSPEVARHAPALVRIMPRLSNVRVRNVATVGGALAHGDPHMDLPPTVMALGGRVRIVGLAGERELEFGDDLARHAGWSEQAKPLHGLVSRHSLRNCRDIGCDLHAACTRYTVGAKSAGPHMRHPAQTGKACERDVTRECISNRRSL